MGFEPEAVAGLVWATLWPALRLSASLCITNGMCVRHCCQLAVPRGI
jgi:hypothetical protein